MPGSIRKSKFHTIFMTTLVLSLWIGISGGQTNAGKNSLYVDPATQDFSKNPQLLKRILSGPHGYFRFINIRFSQEICKRFKNSLADAPSLNLHGDAHIEQYAVTDLGRGLTDFDDSSTGPGIIDWMRFGVSLQLVCRAHGWQGLADSLFGEFLRGYRCALNDPKIKTPEPAIVSKLKLKFTSDLKRYFDWVDSKIEPMPADERDSLVVAMQPYVENMFAEDSVLNRNYFDIEKMGYLRMGIGSALDLKYLVRIRGKTDDPYDDVILEFKQVRDLSGIECINSGPKNDPFRILLGQARIAYQPFQHTGYFSFREYIFWVHSWVENYQEVEIDKTFQSLQELAELAFDIGVQLGKGHVKHIAAPFDLQLRREQMQILNKHEPEITHACREFADLVTAAWEQFRKNIKLTKSGE